MAEVKLEDAPQGVRTYYDKGIAALERNNFDYAMDMLETVLNIEPRLLQVRKLQRAAAVKKARAHPPGKISVAKTVGGFMKASAALKKNPEETVTLCEKLLRVDPLNFKISKLQCDAAEAADLPEIAIQTLEILKDNSPPNLAVLEPLARLYSEAELYDQEYACRESITKLKPNDANALKELKNAAARLTMGKAGWQKAESYRDVIRSDEKESSPTENELDSLIARVESDPENVNNLLALADYYLQNKRQTDGIQILEECISLNNAPDPRIEQKLWTAKEHQLSFQLAEAEDANDESIISELRKQLEDMRITNSSRQAERYPNDLQLKFEYGKLLFNAGHLTEAIQQFQAAQRNPQRRIRALIYMAKAFEQKDQLSIAREQLETALGELHQMDETRKEVLYELGLLCEITGHQDQAQTYLKEIYAVDIGYRDVAVRIENHSNC